MQHGKQHHTMGIQAATHMPHLYVQELMISPGMLAQNNIPVVKAQQFPGEFMINYPGVVDVVNIMSSTECCLHVHLRHPHHHLHPINTIIIHIRCLPLWFQLWIQLCRIMQLCNKIMAAHRLGSAAMCVRSRHCSHPDEHLCRRCTTPSSQAAS